MVGVLAFGFFVWLNSRRKGVLAVVAILSVPLVWFLSPDNTKERFLTLAKSSDIIFQGREALETGNDQDGGPRLGSMATRWEMFQRGFMTFISNPIIGVGMGCYGSYSGRRWGDWFPPHNTYMQLFAELGLIGGFLFMSVIWLTFKNLAESKRILDRMGVKRTFLGSFVPGLATYYCVYLVVAFFGIEIYSNFWWLCGGLSLAVLRITKK
jgi:O-antigen ligase